MAKELILNEAYSGRAIGVNIEQIAGRSAIILLPQHFGIFDDAVTATFNRNAGHDLINEGTLLAFSGPSPSSLLMPFQPGTTLVLQTFEEITQARLNSQDLTDLSWSRSLATRYNTLLQAVAHLKGSEKLSVDKNFGHRFYQPSVQELPLRQILSNIPR